MVAQILADDDSQAGPALIGVALPGHHPASPARPAEGFEGAALRIARLVSERRLAPIHVVGYSLGARLALSLCALRPSAIARATLIGVHPGLERDEERAARRKADSAWIDLLKQEGTEAFARAWVSQPVFASQANLDENTRLERDRERGMHDPIALADAMAQLGLAEMPCYAERLDRIALPLTLVVGGRDEKFTAVARRMLQRLERGRLIVLDGCGHNPVLEAPARVARVVAEETNG